jgi:hypothetical protein
VDETGSWSCFGFSSAEPLRPATRHMTNLHDVHAQFGQTQVTGVCNTDVRNELGTDACMSHTDGLPMLGNVKAEISYANQAPFAI